MFAYAVVVLCARGAHAQVTLQDVVSFTANSNAKFVSNDGNFVSGLSANTSFRWTNAGGMISLGGIDAQENPPIATGASTSGAPVSVGTYDAYNNGQLQRSIARWTQNVGWQDLGQPPTSGETWDQINAPRISADGSTIVAMSQGGSNYKIWRWTNATGNWSLLTSENSWIAGSARINSDGSVIIANKVSGGAYRWSDPTGSFGSWQEIFLVFNSQAVATDLSADGNCVVGTYIIPGSEGQFNVHVFRWKIEFGIQSWLNCGTPVPKIDSAVALVSADGLVIAGTALKGLDRSAFRWTSQSGMTTLGGLPSGSTHAQINAINGNGSILVGQTWHVVSQVSTGFHAVRWTSANGFNNLGLPLGSTDASANAVNSDGTVVVGVVATAVNLGQYQYFTAFRWTAMSGIQKLGALATPIMPSDISTNGSVVVGSAQFGDLFSSNNAHASRDMGNHAFRWTNGGNVDLGVNTALGEIDSQSDMVSGNGLVGVGVARLYDEQTNQTRRKAFRFNSVGAKLSLSPLGGDQESFIGFGNVNTDLTTNNDHDSSQGGRCVSDDGTVVVGSSLNKNGEGSFCHAVAWSAGGVPISLGALNSDSSSTALAVSGDGSTVVGASIGGINSVTGQPFNLTAFRYHNGVLQDLGRLQGTGNSAAFFVSANGSVVVGTSIAFGEGNKSKVFRWTSAGMVENPHWPDDTLNDLYWPMAVSQDGNVILGMSEHYENNSEFTKIRRAFLWRQSSGALIALPEALRHIHSLSLSADGTIVAGSRDAEGQSQVACLWSEATEIIDLKIYLTDQGINMSARNPQQCGISADGHTVIAVDEVNGAESIFVVSGLNLVETSAPIIASIAPTSGTTLGGTAITITGTNLTGASSVTVGGVAATSVVVLSDILITAVTPAGIAGAKDVVVTTPLGTASATAAFSYINIVAPTGVAASDGLFTNKITVTWNAAVGATSYEIFRNGTIIGTSTTTQYDDPTATIGVNFSYAVKSVAATGSSELSTPPAIGWRAPEVPTGLNATDGTFTDKITVSWNAVPSATGYEVKRDGVTIRTAQVQTTTTFNDVVAVGQTFSYTVTASTPAGLGASSAANTGFINVLAPSNVAATDGAFTTRVDVTWNSVANAVGYQIFRSGTTGAIGSTTSALAFSDSLAVPGKKYNYSVKAISAAGSAVNPVVPSASSLINSGYRKVAAPLSVNASDGLADKVTVKWVASEGATGYSVYRTNPSGKVLAGSVTGNGVVTCDDVTAVMGTLYNYTVEAVSTAGASDASVGNTGYRMAPPTGVRASEGTMSTQVLVTWTAAANATGYEVLRRVNSGDTPVTVATVVGGTTVSGGDSGASPNAVYRYSVRANSAAGFSPESSVDTGYRGMPAPTQVAASDGAFESSIQVTWTPIVGATGYEVSRNGVVIAGSVSTSTHIDSFGTGALSLVNYLYTVKAKFGNQKSASSFGNYGWRGPIPRGVTASSVFSDRIDVRWIRLEGVQLYRVYRDGVQLSVKVIGNATHMQVQDTTATPSTTHTYTVRAVFALGLGPSSDSATGVRVSEDSNSLVGDDASSSESYKPSAAATNAASCSSPGTLDAPTNSQLNSLNGHDEIDGASADADGDPRTESQIRCDELFLIIAARIAVEHERLPALVTGVMVVEQPTVDMIDSQRRLRELELQATLDEDMDGILDACQRAEGDVDLSGTVDDCDMVAYISALESAELLIADLNCDGEMDSADLGCLLLAMSTSAAAPMEPLAPSSEGVR